MCSPTSNASSESPNFAIESLLKPCRVLEVLESRNSFDERFLYYCGGVVGVGVQALEGTRPRFSAERVLSDVDS